MVRTPLKSSLILLTALALAIFRAGAQTPASATSPAPTVPATTQEPSAPKGTVLFERHTDPDGTPIPASAQPATTPAPAAELKGTPLTDEERSAIAITAYDLDTRLTPATSQVSTRAHLTLRNGSATPLNRIALQISSTLVWQSATLLDAAHTRLSVEQHLLDTDTDHTGKSNELLLALPRPLAPGESLDLDLFYSGTIAATAERLERIGATHQQALASDWDAVTPTSIALRGFGNVLWYPVASPQLFLGDAAKLFQAIGQSRLQQQNAKVHLHLALEYAGEPPAAVYFCGRRAAFMTVSDNSDAPVASNSGIASANFPAEAIGFRPLSLFVVESPETLIAQISAKTGTKAAEDLLAVETTDEAALPRLSEAAKDIAPLLQQWFGPRPLSSLTVIDHEGQPFEDGPLLVAPINTLSASSSAEALTHSLTHAWVQTGQPWMDEGLAQFMSLLYTEQQQGRDAAIGDLREMLRPVVLAEPAPEALSAGNLEQPLISASDELYYRRKAAAVWWMLRALTSDESLQAALTTLRTQPVSHDSAHDQAVAFERLLEQTSHKDLAWFFNDWVLRDRGFPDLSIVDVTPRQLPAGKGHDSGWVVAVTVRNDGAATAQVPLVIRAGDFSVTRQMRIPGLGSATERFVVEERPTQVLVNDGSMPEIRNSQHSVNVIVKTQ
jgi:hypothetical protein